MGKGKKAASKAGAAGAGAAGAGAGASAAGSASPSSVVVASTMHPTSELDTCLHALRIAIQEIDSWYQTQQQQQQQQGQQQQGQQQQGQQQQGQQQQGQATAATAVPPPSSATIDRLWTELTTRVSPQLERLRALQQQAPQQAPSPSPSHDRTAGLARLSAWLAREAPMSRIGTHVDFSTPATSADNSSRSSSDPAATDEGVGLVALRPMHTHTCFLAIPRRVMLTSAHPMCDRATTASEHSPNFMAPCAFATLFKQSPLLVHMVPTRLATFVHLQRQLREHSFFAPYLESLPTTLSIPLMGRIDELSALRGSPAFVEALHLYRSTVRQYLYLFDYFRQLKLLPPSSPSSGSPSNSTNEWHKLVRQHCELLRRPLANDGADDAHALPDFTFTWDDYRWAVGIVMTRQNRIPSLANATAAAMAGSDASASGPSAPSAKEEEFDLALVPGWDMANHRSSARAITTFFSPFTGTLDALCPAPVMPGEGVHIFYGERTNQHLLLYSGFVDTQHKTDRLSFTMSSVAPLVEPWEKLKVLLLRKADQQAHLATFTLPLPIRAESSSSNDGGGDRGESEAEIAAAEARAEEEERAETTARRAQSYRVRQALHELREQEAATRAAVPNSNGATGNDREEEEEEDHEASLAVTRPPLFERVRNRARYALLMHYLRVMALNKDEATAVLKRTNETRISFVSIDNERRALNMLRDRLRELLAAYPKDVEEEEAAAAAAAVAATTAAAEERERRCLMRQLCSVEQRMIVDAQEQVDRWVAQLEGRASRQA